MNRINRMAGIILSILLILSKIPFPFPRSPFRLLAVLCLLSSVLCLPPPAFAQWNGFPLATNSAAFDWYAVRTNFNPIGQLFSGAVERAAAAGVSTSAVVVETWTFYAGTNLVATNIVTTNAEIVVTNTYTNVMILTTNVTTTNCISPVLYSYTDDSGAHSATGYPYLSNYFMYKLDKLIEATVPYYVLTNAGGSYAAYLQANGDAFPMESMTGLLTRLDIGHVATNGLAEWSRRAPTTSNWVLAESHYTGAWSFAYVQTFGTNFYEQGVLPVLRFLPALSTNAIPASLSATLSGVRYNTNTWALASGTETIAISLTNQPLSNAWYSVTNIALNQSAVTGDVFAVLFTNEIPIFGNWEFEIDAQALDERQQALNALRWTTTAEWYNHGTTNYQTIIEQLPYTYMSTGSYDLARTALTNMGVTGNYTSIVETANYASPGYHVELNSIGATWYGQNAVNSFGVFYPNHVIKWRLDVPFTNIAHTLDWYIFPNNYFGGPGVGIYTNFVTCFTNDLTWCRYTNAPVEAFEYTNYLTFPRVNPALLLSVSDPGDIELRQNFDVSSPSIDKKHRGLIKWDGTNGFRWR